MFDRKGDTHGTTQPKYRETCRAGDKKRVHDDFGQFFAPTVAVSRVRMQTAMACKLYLDVCLFDIDQAFVPRREIIAGVQYVNIEFAIYWTRYHRSDVARECLALVSIMAEDSSRIRIPRMVSGKNDRGENLKTTHRWTKYTGGLSESG